MPKRPPKPRKTPRPKRPTMLPNPHRSTTNRADRSSYPIHTWDFFPSKPRDGQEESDLYLGVFSIMATRRSRRIVSRTPSRFKKVQFSLATTTKTTLMIRCNQIRLNQTLCLVLIVSSTALFEETPLPPKAQTTEAGASRIEATRAEAETPKPTQLIHPRVCKEKFVTCECLQGRVCNAIISDHVPS